MDCIDLLTLVRRFGKLDNIELYGYISSRLPRPINLFDSVKVSADSIFVKMDVLAVNLQSYKQHLKEVGITNKENNDIYLVNGSVALLVNTHGVYPDWYSVRGTLRLGSKTDCSYLTMFNFNKNNGSWGIGYNTLDTMYVGDWSRQSRLYLSLNKSIEMGYITVPEDVAKFPHFYAKLTQGVVTPVKVVDEQVQIREAKDSLSSATEFVQSKGSFEVVNRDTILPFNDKIKNLRNNLNNVIVESSKFIESLKNDYAFEIGVSEKVKFLVTSLRRNLRSKPSSVASTGRVLLGKYLNKFGEYSNSDYHGTKTGKFLIDSFDEVSNYILDNNECVSFNGSAWNLCKKAFGDSELFYARMLGIILGVDTDKLVSTCMYCNGNEISFIKVITTNPYLLLLISNEFSYQEVDYIAYCLGKLNDKSIDEYKLIGIVYDYLNNSDVGSTVYKYSKVVCSTIGVSLTKAKYAQCRSNGTYLSDTVRQNIYFYIDNTVSNESYKYPSVGWTSRGYNYILPLSKNEIEYGLTSAIKHGIVFKFTNNDESWVTSTKLANKELYICEKMYALSQGKKGYDHALIDSYIDEYESTVGFKLEAKQREAVHLIDNYVAIVTGPAGSGKTTVSDCMVYVLNRFESSSIEYAAPTGKAAKRLQEVVKKPVQTFNSKFKIFGGNETLIDEEDLSVSDENVVYFFDEVAMTNINLMYSVCKHLDECCVYFLGDISQLPPIGKGLPFKNLLRFLPCVKLDVTKRSAENSGITYNSRVINEFSEADNWQILKEFSDFKLIPCSEDNIKRITVLLCKYYLNNISISELNELCSLTNKTENDFIKIEDLTDDDIQVVSPVGKSTYTWGTNQLNTELQKVFNKTKGYDNSFRYQVTGGRFTIKDRVIHTDSNMYTMQWYSSYKNGSFQKTYGFGIANGDVGKIVAFYPSQSCEFLDEIGTKPDDFKYPDNIRDDSTFMSEGNWFIVVEYYDFISDSNYYILYRAIESSNTRSNDCREFVGDDLKKLALFYAGTTHKMQGSQSKLIIGILGKVNFSGFITRNMLYTEVTRASDGVYLIGSVSNDMSSQLSIARKSVADEGVDTIQELIFS